MTEGLHGWPQSRADAGEVIYSEVGGKRYRLRFEPGETERWALVKSRWSDVRGEWVEVSTTPITDLHIDVPEQLRDGGGR